MAKCKIYMLYDGRYRTNKNKAICYEACETLKEAKEKAPDYGNDTIIVQYNTDGNIINNPKILNYLT